MGPILATFDYHQRELRGAEEQRQAARDREVDANIHRKEAENQVAQLPRNMERSWGAALEAQETARKHEKDYHETLVLLRWAQAVTPAAANAEAQVRIQSLEMQLNNATQQLRQLRAERAPNAADGQMAVQQSETNEQLEALRAENATTHQALTEVATECDSGLTTQASPQLGGAMSRLNLPHAPTPPSLDEGLTAYLARAGPGSHRSTPVPSPVTGSGLSALTSSPYLGVPAANAGQAQGPGRAMDVEGAGHAPGASTVTTGASSTTTNQGPAQAGSHTSPQ